MLPAQPNQSVIRSLTVLQAVMGQTAPIGSRDLSRLLEMEHTRVSRLLGTLAYLGLVSKTDKGKYQPGPAIHALSAQALYSSKLLPATIPFLEDLRDERTTVALGVLWRESICFLLHARPWQKLAEGIGTHPLHPASESSLGLVLLAFSTQQGYANPEPPADKKVKEELERIRSRGFAAVRFPSKQVSLATKIGSPPIAAIGLSREGIGERQIDALGRQLVEIASKVTERLGEIASQAAGTQAPDPSSHTLLM